MPVRGFDTYPQHPPDTSSGIALYHFVQMRVVFSSVLQVSSSPMSTSRYVRLIAMSATLVLWVTVLTPLTIWEYSIHGLRPWVSWEHVHSGWNSPEVYVWMLMSRQSRALMLLSWWTIPVSSIIFFIFLGFGEDAVEEYRRVSQAIISIIPSRILPGRNQKFTKGMLLASPLPSSGLRFASFLLMTRSNPSHALQRSSSKGLFPYSPSSYIAWPEKTSKLRELILPLPVTARTKTTSKRRATSTVSVPDSLSPLNPSRPVTRSRTADSSFYFHPTASYSMSNNSETTRFSMLEVGGLPTPLSTNAPAMNQTFQELPAIQPLSSLHSMMGLSHSGSRSQSPVKPNERRWSARNKKLRPSPLQLDNATGRLRDCAPAMRTVAVTQPRVALMRGSVQVTIQR